MLEFGFNKIDEIDEDYLQIFTIPCECIYITLALGEGLYEAILSCKLRCLLAKLAGSGQHWCAEKKSQYYSTSKLITHGGWTTIGLGKPVIIL